LKDGEFAWTGKPNVIAKSSEGQDGLIEGPSFCDANGATWCVVSSGYFGGADYKRWIGRIDDIVNGKLTDQRQLLTTESPCLGGRWVGPGHCSLVQEAPGIFSMFFHAWAANQDTAPAFEERFKAGGEGRKPLRATLAFIDEGGKPCEPYIVEDRIKAHLRRSWS
ncbi:MAG: hypothetical protein H7Z43_12400, partial [Clostridia bacterium]|nr:hypothetical protein [Deltaproteobacteria bacterium]